MKLRNKKTGGLANILDKQEFFRVYTDAGWADYGSLAELNEEWEDYKPKESLIKDEKTRKAVRAWAEANDIRFGRRCGSLNAYSRRIVGWNAVGTSFTIEFDKDLKMYGDKITKEFYTIDELCGEDNEED